jgi:transposase
VIEVQVKPDKTAVCPECNSKDLYRHGKAKSRKVLHTLINGKKVYLEIHGRQRWKCKHCGRTFTQELKIIKPRSRLTNYAEKLVLWLLSSMSFKAISKLLKISYGKAKRILMEAKTIPDLLQSAINGAEKLHLGIDEHSFKHQEMVLIITDVKAKKVLEVLKDDRIATLEAFLSEIPPHKVKEVCIDMKEAFRKVASKFFPEANVVVDHFHVIADANKRMDEARRIEQDVRHKGKVRIPKKIFLIARENLSDRGRQKVDELLKTYPNLKGFYWAKERLRDVYKARDKNEAAKLLDLIIMNLKASDDAELYRWGNTLKRWRQPILNYFDNKTTNAYTEGCNTKVKMLKRISFGLRNVEVYTKKIMLGFLPPECFHTI